MAYGLHVENKQFRWVNAIKISFLYIWFSIEVQTLSVCNKAAADISIFFLHFIVSEIPIVVKISDFCSQQTKILELNWIKTTHALLVRL